MVEFFFKDETSERQLRELDILDRFVARQPDAARTTSDHLVATYLRCSGEPFEPVLF